MIWSKIRQNERFKELSNPRLLGMLAMLFVFVLVKIGVDEIQKAKQLHTTYQELMAAAQEITHLTPTSSSLSSSQPVQAPSFVRIREDGANVHYDIEQQPLDIVMRWLDAQLDNSEMSAISIEVNERNQVSGTVALENR